MPTISINRKDYDYDEAAIISFAEGLIGLPALRRAVLIPLEEFAPFCWMASLDDEATRFIVVDPRQIFANYEPEFAGLVGDDAEVLAIVKISSDWRQTTVNLRAPVFVNRRTRRGAQFILSDSRYSHAEIWPQE